MSRRMPYLALALAVCSACGPGPAAEPPYLEPIADEIVRTDAGLVCLGETHGSVHDAALRRAVVTHPDFAERFDVVVVEFASPRHQLRLDRFVLDGRPASRDELRPIWLDAGLGWTWELPMYESFLRAVAKVNGTRPPESRVRVVGAAVPIDWPAVREPADLVEYPDRTDQFERILRREVIEPGRRGMAVFATGHCERRAPAVVARLAEGASERVWVAFGFDGAPGRASARSRFGLSGEPTLVRIRGTDREGQPTGELLFEGHAAAGATLGELTDALVWFGDEPDEILDPLALELDTAVRAELERRVRLWEASKTLALGSG